MPKFAANLTMMFNEVEFLDRFKAAADAGFKGVEFLFPYDFDANDLKQKLDDNNLAIALHNLPAGDWAAGERGIAILPDRTEEFRANVERGIAYATALGCPQVNCLAGIRPDNVSEADLEATFIDNLRYAAGELAKHNVKLIIESINTRDIPGFYLSGTQQALDLIDKVGSDNLFLQYDIYHMQIMEGDLAPTLDAHIDRIAHIQIADTPGRNEPGTGEINYPFLFRHLDAIGYAGWVGCEYKPATTTEAGLGWLAAAS